MKCRNCGEEIKEGQSFCLNCGTPVTRLPELSEFERELANSVDSIIEDEESTVFSLMDDDEEQDFDFDDMEIHQEFSLNEIEMAVNATRQKEEDQVKKQEERKKLDQQRRQKRKREEELRRKAKRKKQLIITGVVIVILAILAGAGYMLYNSWRSRYEEQGDDRSQEYYQQGIKYYNSESYAAALREFEKADEEAVSNKQKEKVKQIIWQTYRNIGNREDDICQVLLELIELNPYEITYYQALIEMYQSLGDSEAMEALFKSIDDEDIYKTLEEYRSQIPGINYEDGEYNTALRLEVTAAEGSTIYYTLRKDKEPLDPTRDSNTYTAPIPLEEEGVWYFKAIAVSSGNSVSGILKRTFTLDFGIPETPVVTPERGSYTGFTDITVESPSGITVYYTIDGEDPTLDDNKYEEPFRMTWGNHVYKFAAINDAGYSSPVVSVIYNCDVDQAYDYDQALEHLKSFLVSQQILENTSGTFADGTSASFSYVDTQIISDVGFYVINMKYLSEEGSTILKQDYAVEFGTGAIAFLAANGDGSYSIQTVLSDPSGRLTDAEGNILGN